MFNSRPDTCFKDDLENTSVAFVIIFSGIISFFRQSLNILMIFIGFPVIIHIFLSNPSEFYANIGVDPQIIDNLPTHPITKNLCDSSSKCVVCLDDFIEGQEILTLRCK